MNINNNKGYLYLETLIVISVISIVFVSGAIAGRNFLLNILVEYEATKLISSIRYVQELNRNSYIAREGEFGKIEPEKSTLFKVVVSDYFYEIKSTSNKFKSIRYYPIKNISYGKSSTFYNGILFDTSGNPKTFGNIRVKSKLGNKTVSRYIIIDKAGRIRLDRKLE